MGGRGSGSGIPSGSMQSFLDSIPDAFMQSIIGEWATLGNYGTKKYQEKFMLNNGVSEGTLADMNRLFDRHRVNGSSDGEIVDHLKANDDVGKALKMQINMEEALYKTHMKAHPNSDDRVYRKGNHKTGVEPWTTNPDGADMGSSSIGWDHQSTIKDLRRQGYHILGGMGRHLGSPGESEITMVKY